MDWESEVRPRRIAILQTMGPQIVEGKALVLSLANPVEAPTVHSVMRAAFQEHQENLDPPSGALRETVEDVRAEMARGGAVLARLQGRPVGTVRFRVLPDHLYAGRLGVLPEYRRIGAARAMMQYLEVIAAALGAPEIRLGTRKKLTANTAFYLSIGFEEVGLRPHPRGQDLISLFRKPVEAAEPPSSLGG
ncbi:MAG TPA: GNAT family N-acetyltransferase [Chthonomonadales bacterium]|nr:GNAT family N-acetyltransferase [Chthonomonadales bacterium]